MIETNVVRRGRDRGVERIERAVPICESPRMQAALDLRMVQAADHLSIEHRRAAGQLHGHRRGALAQRRQQLAQVARLQVDAQLAAGRAGDRDARVRQAEPRMPQIEDLARRIPIRGDIAFDRRASHGRPDVERGHQMQCPRVGKRAFHLQRAAGRAVPGQRRGDGEARHAAHIETGHGAIHRVAVEVAQSDGAGVVAAQRVDQYLVQLQIVATAEHGRRDVNLGGKRLAAQHGLASKPHRMHGDRAQIGSQRAGGREIVQPDTGVVIFQAGRDQMAGERHIDAAAPDAAAITSAVPRSSSLVSKMRSASPLSRRP